VDALDYRCDAFVEVVEVSDQLYEAEVDEGVLAAHDAAVDFLFSSGAGELCGELAHDPVDSLVEFLGQFFVDVVSGPFEHLPNVIVDECDVFEVLLIQFHQRGGGLLFLGHKGGVIQWFFIQSFESGQLLLDDLLLLVVFEGVHEVRQSGEGLQRGDDIGRVPEEVVADI